MTQSVRQMPQSACAICDREVPKVGTVSLLCDRCKAVLRTARKHGIKDPHLPLTTRREFWLPATGRATGYRVSNRGRVRSARKILKTPPNTNGYPCVTIQKRTYVHKLVLETWVCPMPPGKEALHDNDIRADARLVNLRWGTRSENNRQCVRNGRHPQASKTECPKGHKYTPENTCYRTRGGRTCRTCHRVISRESWARRKAARLSRTSCTDPIPGPQIDSPGRKGPVRSHLSRTAPGRLSEARP